MGGGADKRQPNWGSGDRRRLSTTTLTGLTEGLLYSTASYKEKNLKGIEFGGEDDLSGWDFSGQNLTNAALSSSTLTNANLTGANLRNAYIGGASDLTSVSVDSRHRLQPVDRVSGGL